jgi:hypothetical protein
LSGPVHRSVHSRDSNYQFQYARGKTSLTNKFWLHSITQATSRNRGWWFFIFLTDFQPFSICTKEKSQWNP